ncbi:MAG: ABC transporter permease [bacterium]
MFKTVFSQNTRDLIWQFVKTEFKLKYNNSVLGFVWVLVKPLVIFLILFLVMSRVFPNAGMQYYPLYLLLGTIISGHFNEATMTGINALLNKQSLILKVNFPRYIVIISSMLLPLINFVINLSIYFIIAIIFFGRVPGLFSLLWFVLAYAILFIFMFGFALFTSIWHVKLRDIGSIWELCLQLIFWLTPVFYDLETIRNKAGNSFISSAINFVVGEMNPVSVFLQISREAFMYDRITRPLLLFYWAIASILFATAGYFFFKKNVKKIAENF